MRGILVIGAILTVAGCSKVEDTSTLQNDSLAIVPVGPGTMPDAVVPPDTLQSRPEAPVDSAKPDTTHSGH